MKPIDKQSAEPEADTRDKVVRIVERIGSVAEGLLRKVSWFVGFGVLASVYLAWLVYSPESAWWWNAIKCVIVCLPALLWSFIWFVLSQLSEAPTQVAGLMDGDNQLVGHLKAMHLGERKGVRGLFSTLNAVRNEEAFSAVFDTIGGVTLLANPLFAFIALVTGLLLLLLVLIAALFLVF
ncbi:hypothetical protein GCM10008090_03330 [Arenicella chitinivorans]|uniref:Uncharacterized protein n=1 Tax=Arenicella chitinivorans TaxID=1329800 RepID=A0A918VHJ2_9GAMM|nr:hypothetical protein [Arenicella chitinivorans]GGZ98258.1 hypothetical protein GCM10008090_03330 [Arenicella chitinivorans]